MTTNGTIRVLLIDDHKSLLWGLAKLIDGESPRMQVVGAASNRAEAFALAAEKQPDVILLDIDLGADGSTLNFLPDLLRESAARVLMLTGLRGSDVHDRAVELGARGVVLKEESPDVIIQAIEKVSAGGYWLDPAAPGRLASRKVNEEEKKAPPKPEGIEELTEAELRVVEQVVRQASSTSKEIADSMNMSVKTLNNHLTKIYSKLGAKNRLELFIYALKNNLADLSS
ncbi:MAG TPA: response regulator transcription factor [Pyrinomonadaceae bacterium]|nr:response regulator transcription factor [Pyrinomonadaceae bacterium]